MAMKFSLRHQYCCHLGNCWLAIIHSSSFTPPWCTRIKNLHMRRRTLPFSICVGVRYPFSICVGWHSHFPYTSAGVTISKISLSSASFQIHCGHYNREAYLIYKQKWVKLPVKLQHYTPFSMRHVTRLN